MPPLWGMGETMRLLDLYCSAGGCTKGYQQAGFEVVGVDIKPQPRYCGDAFVQMDALEALRILIADGYIESADGRRWYLTDFCAISASPPCQGYSKTQSIQGNDHPMLIEDTRKLLIASGKPYIIENVKGAPLKDATLLVGSMFRLQTMRPRLFETSFSLPFVLAPPPHAKHAEMGRKPKPGEYVHVVGHISDIAYCRDAMGIDWMNGKELSQAIPPSYTEWIGRHLIEQLETA
jgi:DNA (cytosine-5)-methyltransferase 1